MEKEHTSEAIQFPQESHALKQLQNHTCPALSSVSKEKLELLKTLGKK